MPSPVGVTLLLLAWFPLRNTCCRSKFVRGTYERCLTTVSTSLARGSAKSRKAGVSLAQTCLWSASWWTADSLMQRVSTRRCTIMTPVPRRRTCALGCRMALSTLGTMTLAMPSTRASSRLPPAIWWWLNSMASTISTWVGLRALPTWQFTGIFTLWTLLIALLVSIGVTGTPYMSMMWGSMP